VRAACIDIGSNTTRLLVADRVGAHLIEIHQERAFTRIGVGLSRTGTIGEEKIGEVVAVVRRQLATARGQGAEAIRCIATAAIRRASNRQDLVEAIARGTGLEVEILSGEEEARLAFVGAATLLDDGPMGELGVVDVGGGSSELVVGMAPDTVTWWASVDLGSGALTEHWLRSDPPPAPELAAARAEISAALAGLDPPRPARAVAVGGSATSLCRLAGPVLDAEALDGALALLTSQPAAEVGAHSEIDPRRARLMPAGLLILQAAAELFGTALTVGQGGIREGVLLEGRTR
jgi:exopolyphosphatase / guanosine-5'-triphosphate,3'-diphosphate pyrophosphatase